MKLKFKNQEALLYLSLNDCRKDSNKKGYGCVKKKLSNGSYTTYYFDLVPTTDYWATKLRYKKSGSSTVYAIATSNHVILRNWAQHKYPDTYATLTSFSQQDTALFNSPVQITELYYSFQGCEKLTSINVSTWDTSKVTTMYNIFEDCKSLTTLDVSKWDVSNVDSSLNLLFCNCENLKTLDVSKWNTSKITGIYQTFLGCKSLTTLDLSKWNVSNVRDLYNAFRDCNSLTSLNVSTWNTSKVDNMYGTFRDCNSLTSLNVSNWNTSNVKDMDGAFRDCHSLTSLNVSNWNVSNVTDFRSMFEGCESLTSLDLSSWNTSKAKAIFRIFYNCTNLKCVDVSNFDTSSIETKSDGTHQVYNMFSQCPNLQYIIIGSTTFKFKLFNTLVSDGNVFWFNSTLKILVPSALLNTYKNADVWKLTASQFDAIENYNITRSNGRVTVTHK